jgi:hypothetical protein
VDAKKIGPEKIAKKIANPSRRLKPVIHVAHGFDQAREWEILQEITMTPAQRQRVAKALKERFYGRNAPDVRAAHLSR